MKKQLFIASLCHRGMLGGDLTADGNALTYRTAKLTVTRELRHLEMKYTDILAVTKDKAGVFPAVNIHMKNGKDYKFVVFLARKRLMDLVKSHGVNVIS